MMGAARSTAAMLDEILRNKQAHPGAEVFLTLMTTRWRQMTTPERSNNSILSHNTPYQFMRPSIQRHIETEHTHAQIS